MEIKKLKLKNFRNFKNCEINFSCDKSKNFTIILGQNTYGKTTLVKAFIWCLYRENLFKDKILLNRDVANRIGKSNTEITSVEIELNHNDFSYKITTKQEFCLNSSGNVSYIDAPKTTIVKVDENASSFILTGSSASDEIENILRSELKEYFFFDGETNSIDAVASKKNLTNAVSNILGLSKIEFLKEYFDPNKSESVVSYLERELVQDDNDDLNDLTERKTELLNQKDNFESKEKSIKDEIKKLQEQKQHDEDILNANRDVEKYQRDKVNLEKEIRQNRENRDNKFEALINTINSKEAFLKTLFSFSYIKFNLGNLKEESSFKSNDSYVGITEDAVNELIKKGKCICGAEIKNGNDAYNHLVAAKEHMEPHDYGKYIDDFVSGEASNVYMGSSIKENINSFCSDVLDGIQQIDEDKEKIEDIKKRLEGRMDVGEIQRQINNIDRQIWTNENTLGQITNNDLPNILKSIQSINDKIDRATSNDEKNKFTKKCLYYSKYIYDIALNRMTNSKKLIKDRLQDEVSTIFKSMYHGNRSIKIDDNFKAETYATVFGKDQKIDESTGLGTVVNYSFVAGLMNLAKKQILNDDNDDDTVDLEEKSQTYPLVMDAPFSNTDDTHIKNICEALNKYCDQIIMFIMEKDFNYAKESIADKIGKKYKINQLSETESEIEEVL